MEKYIVIAGMPKTGTTLPLVLLDSHDQLLVFPEELRFFHTDADCGNGEEASERFLGNGNIQSLSFKNKFFDRSDYMAHGGTGFGRRDYSNFDFRGFQSLVKEGFVKAKTKKQRFDSIVDAFSGSIDSDRKRKDNIFVCKAPHNEVFVKKWVEMLGDKVKFIICTRDPVEHFFSLKNISNMTSGIPAYNLDPLAYASEFKKRIKNWNCLGENQKHILVYDDLISNPEKIMSEICSFIGINYSEKVLFPTKMGIPWSGNSSRGIVSENIFDNKKIARENLDQMTVRTIERNLHDFIHTYFPQEEEISPSNSLERSCDILKSLILLPQIYRPRVYDQLPLTVKKIWQKLR